MVDGILTPVSGGTISRHIYGHFSEHLGRCIYEGIWVGEDASIPHVEGYRTDVLDALRNLKIPVLRWPGGCFADEYHWMDGIGPRESRPTMINTHWGGVTENNHFGTHEFFRLCELIDAEPYICGNLGSGTVREMSEWIEYMTFPGKSPMADLRRKNGREEPFRLKYFGVGNESWGCGGSMTVEHYADEYKRYQVYCRNFGPEPLFKIACGSHDTNWHWTEVMMREVMKINPYGDLRRMQGLSFHYYTVIRHPDLRMKAATGFGPEEYYAILAETLKMEEYLRIHGAIMDKYDPDRRVALVVDEWGTWYAVEPGTNPGFLYQQNTMRDALVAAINLNLFNRNCHRVRMANIAQLVNVLQAVVLTEGDRILMTPTYHVFEMYKGHQDAELVDLKLADRRLEVDGKVLPAVSGSASRAADGSILVTLANLSHDTGETVHLYAPECGDVLEARELYSAGAMDACNTFDNPGEIAPTPMAGVLREDGWLSIPLRPMSVAAVRLAPFPTRA